MKRRRKPHWTDNPKTGRSNDSPLFEELVVDVESIIRRDAHTLINGGANSTARLIVAQLAHRHGLAPGETRIRSGFLAIFLPYLMAGTF